MIATKNTKTRKKINMQFLCFLCFFWVKKYRYLASAAFLLAALSFSDQPNIIFILADDLSYRDLSCYGQQRYRTPNLDRLAVEGLRFSQAYSAAPECAPSRGSLLTGLHTGHGSIRANSSARGQEHLRDEDVTIAEVLKGAGYRTGFVGKWGVGLPGSEGVPYKQGFDYCFGFYDQSRAHTYIPDYLWENDRRIEYPENAGFDMLRRYDYVGNKPHNQYDEHGNLFLPELKDPRTFTYSENEVEKAALRFLSKNDPSKTGAPFFLYYATQLPHGPVICDQLFGMDKPAEANQLSREWAAMVLKLDAFVGSLVERLKAMGVYENTIIFFASDNGYSMCGYTERGNGPDWLDDPWLKNKGPFAGGKFSVLEGGCRVPFFVHWPGKVAAGVCDEPVWLPDFFPTAIELAGEPAHPSDGLSLLPLLVGNEEAFAGHPYLYFSKNREQAVRMGEWKAYRKSPDAKTELYLIGEDTYTQRDLADIYPGIVKKAEQIMASEHTPHPWYWNPNETAQDYAAKKQRAVQSGEVLPVFRPNGLSRFPWERE